MAGVSARPGGRREAFLINHLLEYAHRQQAVHVSSSPKFKAFIIAQSAMKQ